jgi:pimeloyl-ACP methyl ester carboxylesterase
LDPAAPWREPVDVATIPRRARLAACGTMAFVPYAEVDGIRLHYEVDGFGPPLLLVSGMGAPAVAWDPVLVQRMAQHHTVITFDNRGTGLSDKPDEPYSIALFASDAVGLLDALERPRAHVFGASMGGMVALEMGAHYQDRVASLTLACTTPGGRNAVPAPPESLAALQSRGSLGPEESTLVAWRLAYSEAYVRDHRDELEADAARAQQQVTPPDAFERHFQATMTLRVFPYLKDITAATLVATGRDDVLIPAANSEILAREIAGAELVVFDGAGHGFLLEARDRFLPVWEDFLARQDG